MLFMGNMIRHFPLIILAGGKSSRMGTPKGLINYRGDFWLLEQLRRFKAASGERTVIVLGFHHEQYFEKISWSRTAVNESVNQLGLNISVVVNPNPEYGQFSSLLSAISILSVRPPCSGQLPEGPGFAFPERRTPTPEGNFFIPGAFVLPVDVPGPQKKVYERLTGVFGEPVEAVIPRYQSKGGHPVLLSRAFLRRLATVSPSSAEARLDLQIRSLPVDRVTFVPVDDAFVCLNMNSLDEFQSYSNQ